MENKNQSAFPVIATEQTITNQSPQEPQPGLTKREYFAAMAMQGILSSSSEGEIGGGFNKEVNLASLSIRIADEVLKQLE